jgi:hypothetical protein
VRGLLGDFPTGRTLADIEGRFLGDLAPNTSGVDRLRVGVAGYPLDQDNAVERGDGDPVTAAESDVCNPGDAGLHPRGSGARILPSLRIRRP